MRWVRGCLLFVSPIEYSRKLELKGMLIFIKVQDFKINSVGGEVNQRGDPELREVICVLAVGADVIITECIQWCVMVDKARNALWVPGSPSDQRKK